jgi:hypothetical protein
MRGARPPNRPSMLPLHTCSISEENGQASATKSNKDRFPMFDALESTALPMEWCFQVVVCSSFQLRTHHWKRLQLIVCLPQKKQIM